MRMTSLTTRRPARARLRRRLIAGAALAVAACGSPVAAWAGSTVSVQHPWFRFLLPSIPAGGYMTLHNPTDQPAVLIAAKSPACGMMMLHKTMHANGQEQMVQVKRIIVPAHGSFSFHPGFYHVMCTHPKMKPGDTVPVTLLFDHAASMTVPFRVYGATGRPAAK